MRDLAFLLEEDAARIAGAVDLGGLAGARILLTGATGQIGTHLLATLLQASRSIAPGLSLVCATSSRPPERLARLFSDPAVSHVRADLADPQQSRDLPGADIIIHAAGYGQPARFLADPLRTITTHTIATGHLLEKLAIGGRFLFVSSSEVYSGSPHLPHRETDIGTTDPSHPRACYIEGKRCGETVCHAFRAKGRHAVIARMSLAYGPGGAQDDQRVLNALVVRALQEGRIRLQDRGGAVRTYCYVADAVAMLLSVLLHGREATYNIGGVSRVTILELAREIGRITGVPVELPEIEENRAGAPAEVAVDLSRIVGEFGQPDFTPLDAGLRKTADWYRLLLAQEARA